MSDKKNKEREQRLLQAVDEFNETYGIKTAAGKMDNRELVEQYLLPGIELNKEILSRLYLPISEASGGLKTKLKTFILRKVSNIAINTTERSMMRQQKFNDQTAYLLKYLYEENEKLRKELRELHKVKQDNGTDKVSN